MLRLLLVCCACAAPGRCCSRRLREAADVVQAGFLDKLRGAECGEDGDPCKWDRECCEGYECSMGAGGGGLGLYCRAAAPAPPTAAPGETDAGTEALALPGAAGDDGQSGSWMTRRDGDDWSSERERPAHRAQSGDAAGDLSQLREGEREALARENAELERLFTAREERELEQLRALREDAEADELRRLKALRLKRKLQLLRELKQLRRMRDEARLDAVEAAERAKEEGVREEGEEEEDRGAEEEREGVQDGSIGTANNTSITTSDNAAPETEVTTKRARQGIKGNRSKHGKKQQKNKDPEKNATEVKEESTNATTAAMTNLT